LQLPGSFSITPLLDRELSRLSNGQVKKMIILKQLLDTIPKVLLLDYPFEGLDVKSRTDLSEFLNHLALLHKIQLIITGHEHEQLPSVISKQIDLKTSEVRITDRLGNILPNIQNDSKPVRKATEPIVEFHDVTIRYGSNVIVENLTWIVNKGERWALTGRNGSGKTTIFSLIYADHPMAYSEKVFLYGKRRGSGESIWDIKKRISYLGPEQLHFLDYPTGQLTVREFLIQTKSSITQLNQLVDYFKIEPWLSFRLRQLSHGQLQLILMLALFLSQKELLLLDEPFQFFDPVQKARVNEYLHSHLDDSTTLILITHYEEDVARWTQHRLAL
jgi:molybdate transport system ATP-binding protein